MQKLILSISLLGLVNIADAQLKQGVIVYERKLNLHKNIPKEDERMKNMIAEFSSSRVKLIFSGDESVSSNMEAEPDILETAGGDGDNRLRIKVDHPDVEMYRNFKSGKTVEQRSLGPRKYIIEDAIPEYKWQLKEEAKTIKGFNCKKAVTRDRDNKEVIAWYTEEINTPSGPDHWGGLPGMILGLEIDDASIVYAAVSIETDLKSQVVKTPTSGKKIGRQEFDKMMRESMPPEERSGRIIFRTIDQ